jgi:uncharacterized phage-associated protein
VVCKIKAIDYSVIDAANEIIKRAKEDKITLNLTKLQKLMYFVYGEFLLRDQIRLFKDDEPRKLPYGPVFSSLYDVTKKLGVENEILEEYKDKTKNLGDLNIVDFNFKDDLQNILENVWNEHKSKTAKELSDDTHKEGYAWDKVEKYDYPLKDEDIVAEFEDRRKEKILKK